MSIITRIPQLAVRYKRPAGLAIVTVLCSVAGFYGVRSGFAATFMKSAEAESGLLSGNVGSGDSQGASGGSSLRFGLADTSLSRDPLKQPFSSDSIWNMPIGSGAVYVPAGLDPTPGPDEWTPMPQIDDEPIIMKSSAPLTQLMTSSAAWTGANRCAATGGLLASVPIPTNYVLPNSGDNNSAAFLMTDGRTVLQAQPLARCTTGGVATSLLTFANEDLYGKGISGAHGGSRLSALGGSIRLGELRPGQQGPRHALKVDVNSPVDLFKCQSLSQCFRWPAATADGGAVGDYGTQSNNQNSAMKMGALLAIGSSTNIASLGLESEPGRQIAWTLQNYGAYIVDSTGGPSFALCAETGPDGSLRNQFQSDYSMPFEQRINSNTAWSRDMSRIIGVLQVIDNNSATAVGGGGAPRQPLAPAIAP